VAESQPSQPSPLTKQILHHTHIFSTKSSPFKHFDGLPIREDALTTALYATNKNKEDKFSFKQRIESIKTAVIGLAAGGVASTPFIFLHDVLFPVDSSYTSGFSSWEFDTDMGSLQAALFAIVYRYCVREEDDNEMLNMGVVGAFVVVRTLSRVHVPSYCTAAPLDCGDPLGYFDFNMIQQLVLNGLESAALFAGTAAAMEYAYERNWVSKFPN